MCDPDPGRLAARGSQSVEPGCERSKIDSGGDDPAFLVGLPVGAQGLGLILRGEGDVQDGDGRGAARAGHRLCGDLEHGAVIGPNEPINEAFALEGQCLGGAAGVLELLQDEGAQEDLAAGIEATLRFTGAIERGELGLQLGALRLEGFESTAARGVVSRNAAAEGTRRQERRTYEFPAKPGNSTRVQGLRPRNPCRRPEADRSHCVRGLLPLTPHSLRSQPLLAVG